MSSPFTSRDYRVFAVALALAALVCLGATIWAATDLLAEANSPTVLTTLFGVAMTALNGGAALWLRRKAVQGEETS